MTIKLLKGKLRQGTIESAGYDLFANIEAPVSIWPGEKIMIPTGVVVDMDFPYYAKIFDRSSMATKKGLTTIAGVIDADFDREWSVALFNLGNQCVTVQPGDRVAQVVFMRSEHDIRPVGKGSEIVYGDKREGGFGSTGA